MVIETGPVQRGSVLPHTLDPRGRLVQDFDTLPVIPTVSNPNRSSAVRLSGNNVVTRTSTSLVRALLDLPLQPCTSILLSCEIQGLLWSHWTLEERRIVASSVAKRAVPSDHKNVKLSLETQYETGARMRNLLATQSKDILQTDPPPDF
ncbi:hypothetical protein BaRGS_00029982 [Batillaria attramentaria]|uniref:Uncharacterized protein n=1 Tax=Batillaria attramentaria TaxID=370345 RepID=A0ABD0JVP5_9CAEN